MTDPEFEPCDACGVRSYVFIELQDGRELSYCGSHFRKFENALTNMGAHILDLRYAITP